jgi:hypothetical protein
VIRTPADIPGMTPLAHAPATVIKLHGDYADLLMRNTVDELDSYPAEWDALLDRVLEEYGLIVSGWSADWDKALVAAHRRVRSRRRRYPLFWDSRSSKGEAAKISDCHGSSTGARAWLRIRSYISMARKYDLNVLTALRDAITGKPWKPVAAAT